MLWTLSVIKLCQRCCHQANKRSSLITVTAKTTLSKSPKKSMCFHSSINMKASMTENGVSEWTSGNSNTIMSQLYQSLENAHRQTDRHLLSCFEPVCRRHDQLHAFLGMKHQLLPLGRDSLANRPHNVNAVVICLNQLLDLLCHLHRHLVGLLHVSHTHIFHTISHTSQLSVT